MNEVIIVQCENGEWSGLYVNDILKYEGHNISSDNFIELIREYKTFKNVTLFEISEEHMELLGDSFPVNFNDVSIKIN